MVISNELNVAGPKKRKTLQSVRQRSLEEDADITASLAECSREQQDSNFSRESSVNPSRSTCEQEDSIDSDDSLSDAYTDDMEERRDITDDDLSNLDGFQFESLRYSPNWNKSIKNGNEYVSIWISIAVIFVIVLAFIGTKDSSYGSSNVTDPSVACEEFYKLEERYKTIDDKIWDMLQVTVERATATDEKREPGTILFLHYGPTVILDDLINTVSNITACSFGGSEPVTLEGKHFMRSNLQEDYGVFVSELREELLQRGVLVVRNLQDVPAWAAQAFHTICDTQEPLVKSAVIYLTFDIHKAVDVSIPASGVSATVEAEKIFHELWNDSLGPAVLQPLITRLTENVYRIV